MSADIKDYMYVCVHKTLNTSVRSTENGTVYLDSGLMTATGGRFQAFPIDDSNAPPHVPDQPLFLQRACRCIDRRSSNPEHLRKELLRKWKAILTGMIVGHQQPSSATLFHSVQPVARRSNEDLPH